MLNHTSIKACFEHFDLLTVNEPDISPPTQSRVAMITWLVNDP